MRQLEAAGIDTSLDKLSMQKGENKDQLESSRGQRYLRIDDDDDDDDFEMGETQGCLSADGKKPDKERVEIQQGEMPGWRMHGSPRNLEAGEQQEN